MPIHVACLLLTVHVTSINHGYELVAHPANAPTDRCLRQLHDRRDFLIRLASCMQIENLQVEGAECAVERVDVEAQQAVVVGARGSCPL